MRPVVGQHHPWLHALVQFHRLFKLRHREFLVTPPGYALAPEVPIDRVRAAKPEQTERGVISKVAQIVWVIAARLGRIVVAAKELVARTWLQVDALKAKPHIADLNALVGASRKSLVF